MDKKKEFEVCLELLQQVVAARGRDPAKVADEYAWPAAEGASAAESPVAAVSLAPLLTGGGQQPQPTVSGSGVVPAPAGLTPPKS